MLRNLLVYRLVLLNALGFAGVAWAFIHGYVGMVFADEKTGIGYALVALFAFGLVSTAIRAWKVAGLGRGCGGRGDDRGGSGRRWRGRPATA